MWAGLTLPESVSLVSGDNPVYIGDIICGVSKDVNWTIVFTEHGTFNLDVNASGYYDGVTYVEKHGYATVTVLERPEHDLAVSLETPIFIEPGDSSLLNATVHNWGLNNETNVELQLLINSIIVDNATIIELVNNTSYKIDYEWTPTTEATYNITVHTPPVAGEDNTMNNVATNFVAVTHPLIRPVEGQWANYTVFYYDSNDQMAYSEYWNLTYHHYVEPYMIYVTVWLRSSYGYVETDWMTINIWNRYVESGIWTDMWYPGWIETNITIGSTINLLSGTATVTGSRILTVGPYPIDCWELSMSGGGYESSFWFDKASGLWIGMDQPSYYRTELRLVETNVPIGAAYEHELAVSLEAPSHLEPDDSSLLNATVYNIGLSNETDVEIQLLINGTEVAGETLDEFVNGTWHTINHSWTPTTEGMYNITAYAPPVPGENFTTNNIITRFVYVYYIEVALISDHSELLAVTPILDSIGIGYDIYSDNYMNLYTEDLNLLFNYSTVIFYNYNRLITLSEHSTLESYLAAGGNLLVTGYDSLGSPEDTLLADVVCSYTYGDNTGESDLYVTDASHPIMDGSYGSFPEGYHVSGLYSDCDAAEADTSGGAVTVAELADGYDKIIVAYVAPGRVVYWNGKGPDDWTGNADCEAMFKNVMIWLETCYEHDLAVSLETPVYSLPSDSCLLNVTAFNYGLENESDVVVQLFINGSVELNEVISDLANGTSTIFSHNWTPEPGWYNVTAYVQPVSGENYTRNNRAIRWVDVSTSPRHLGNIVVKGNETFAIEDVYFTQTGNVFVRDNATLIIRNATLNLNQTSYRQYRIEISRSARLVTQDAFVISQYYFDTCFLDLAEGYVNSTIYSYAADTLPSWPIGYVYVEDYANLEVHNSTLYYLYCYDDSVVSVHDSLSTISYLYCYDRSLVSLYNSTLNRLYISAWGSSDVALHDSSVDYINLGFAGSSNASLNDLNLGLHDFWNIYINCTVEAISWNLTLSNTDVTNGWQLNCHSSSVVSVYNSTLRYLYCYDSSVVSVFDSEVVYGLYISAWGSSNVSLINSSVGYSRLLFRGSSSASLSHLKPALYGFWNIHVNGTVSGVDWNLTLVDTEVTQGWEISCYDDSVVSVYDSTLGYLLCHHDSVVSVYDSTVRTLRCYYDSAVSIYDSAVKYLDAYSFMGTICFDNATLEYNWYNSGSQYYVYGNVSLAEYAYVSLWNSDLTRNYNVQVSETDGSPIQNALLRLLDLNGSLIWNGLTDAQGRADFNLTFTEGNYTATLTLEAEVLGCYAAVDVLLLSDTPIQLVLSPAPVVSILSPENKTYAVNDVPLTFTVSEPASWIGYSLDSQMNETISGNTTLLGLAEGAHSVIVYANDTAGNMGTSNTVYFTVDTTLPIIEILSPENTTYTASSVPLTFTINEPTSWIGYSLDGQANETITGNTTLTSLQEGAHYITVYANDTAGNMGYSDMVYFTVHIDTGTLTVTTSPVAGEVFVDLVSWGIAPQSRVVEVGTYNVTFGFVAGYCTPAWQLAIVQENTEATVTGVYEPLEPVSHTLTIVSSPISGVSFTVDGITHTTPWAGLLDEGDHTIVMPSSFEICNFDHWDDSSTNPTRTVSLTADTTITAYYVEREWILSVNSDPFSDVEFTVDGDAQTTPHSASHVEGSCTVVVPSSWTIDGDVYNFAHWEDESTNPTRTISLTSDMSVTAYYALAPKYWTLTVNSDPITDVEFTLDGALQTTSYSASLIEGSHTITMPSSWTVGEDVYNFAHWEDESTNPTRTITLTEDTTITATYELYVPPPGWIEGYVTDVETGASLASATVVADGASTTTNTVGYYKIELDPGDYTVTVSAPGYNDKSKTATVTAEETTTINFALAAQGVVAEEITEPENVNATNPFIVDATEEASTSIIISEISDPITIVVKEVTDPVGVDPPPGTWEVLGNYVEITVNNTDITVSATIRIYYTLEQLEASGLDENTLEIRFWNATSGEWEAVESHVNKEEHYVWAIVDHFSLWTLMGQPTASSQTPLWLLIPVVFSVIVIAIAAIYVRRRKTPTAHSNQRPVNLRVNFA